MLGRRKQYKDSEIITLMQSGRSEEVLRHLYKVTQPKIKRWILQNSGSEAESQDVFQDAVISLYTFVLDGRFDASKSVDGFLFTTARNLWINRAKHQSRYVSGLPIHLPAEEQAENGESADSRIQALLARLGKVCEDILTYSIFYKMSMEDIALRMGLANANTAKTKNYKCKQRLALLVKDKAGLKAYLGHE